MKKIFTIFLLTVIWGISFSQQQNKLGLKCYMQLQNPEFSQSEKLYPLLVQGDPATIAALTQKYKGIYKYSVNQISAIAIPTNHLIAFSNEKAVIRIDNNFAKGYKMADSVRIRSNVDSAHNGIAPLTQKYKGKNVIIGIIDGGIDFNHGDFKDSSGYTRFKYIWDHLGSGSAPAPYSYGAEWNSAQIMAGQCTQLQINSVDKGHSTHVTGLAAGNGLSQSGNATLQNTYRGMAPESNIIFVRIDFNSNTFTNDIADAVDYIYKKADALGLPCVINCSLGTYYGSHDGSDLAAQSIAANIRAKAGRAMVTAAGNAGNIAHHLSYSLSNTDSLFTWFSAASKDKYFDFWADTAAFNNAALFKIGLNTATGINRGQTKYYKVPTDFMAFGSSVLKYDTIRNASNNVIGTIMINAELVGNTYHVEFMCNSDTASHLWRLQTIGSGTFDCWASSSLIGSADIKTNSPASAANIRYRMPDVNKTIVSSFQCLDEVITVGNYTSRSSCSTLAGNYSFITGGNVIEKIYTSSSHGPTRDNRMKPDIVAGGTTISSGDSIKIADLIATGQSNAVTTGGKHIRYIGTSMSSPVVAGIVALLLEQDPQRNYSDIYTAIKNTAKKDAYTTATPNNIYGNGKINAYRALLYFKDYVWTGAVSTDWNNASNWTPAGVPNDCAHNISIPNTVSNFPILNSNASVGKVNIADNASLTITTGQLQVCKNWTGGASSPAIINGNGLVVFYTTDTQTIANKTNFKLLKISNSKAVKNTGSIIIDSLFIPQAGSFITNNNLLFSSKSATHCATIDMAIANIGSISGNIVSERYVPIVGSNQHLIASPIDNLPFSQWGASGVAGYVIPLNCDETQSATNSPYGTVFQYHENAAAGCALAGWEVKTAGAADNARGYSVYLNGNQTLSITGNATMQNQYTTTGFTNSGWAQHNSLQGRPMNAGWNLAGNPYLSVIELQPKAGFDAQVQLWQTSGPYSGTYQPLMMGSNAVIASHQGFMVHTTALGNSSFSVSRSECVNSPATRFYKNDNNELKISLATSNNHNDVTYIRFNPSATADFDPQYDANKPYGNLTQPTLFTKLNNIGFAINSLPSVAGNNAVPMNLYVGKDAIGTLTFDCNSLDNAIHVYLEDKYNGIAWQNMRWQPTYNFTMGKNDAVDRFVVHFDTMAAINAIENIANPTTIYNFQKQLFIEKNNNENATVYIIDAIGNVVSKFDFREAKYTTILPFATGVYFIKIEQANGIISKKIVLY